MPISSKIQRLKENQDLEGLEKALRHPADFILRRDAAQALGELNDLDAVEWLIRSSLEDPDKTVQQAALKALDDLIGSEANLAIATYRNGPAAPDAWLKDFPASTISLKDHVDLFATSSSDSDKIRSLKADGNLDGLMYWLRNPVDPLSREDAAMAIGDLGDLKGVDALIRSHLDDPIEEVRTVAYEALENLVGSQVDLAISAYQSGPAEKDAWLLDHSNEPDEAPAGDEEWEEVASEDLMDYLAEGSGDSEVPEEVDLEQVKWDRQNLDGLISVLRNETDPTLRLRAIQALEHSSNIHAISFLAQTSLYNEDEELRLAAKAALHNRFGDDADGIIESYRDTDREDENEDEEEVETGEEGEESMQPESEYPKTAPVSAFSNQPVIREDKMDWRIIAAVLAVVAIAAILIFIIKP